MACWNEGRRLKSLLVIIFTAVFRYFPGQAQSWCCFLCLVGSAVTDEVPSIAPVVMLMLLLRRRSAETTVRLSSHPTQSDWLHSGQSGKKKKNLCYFAAPLAQKAQQFHHLPPPVQAQLVAVFMFSATLGCKCWNGLDGSHVKHFRELWKLPWEAAGVKSAVDGGSSLLFTSKHNRFFFSQGEWPPGALRFIPHPPKKQKASEMTETCLGVHNWLNHLREQIKSRNDQDENNNHNKMCPQS